MLMHGYKIYSQHITSYTTQLLQSDFSCLDYSHAMQYRLMIGMSLIRL